MEHGSHVVANEKSTDDIAEIPVDHHSREYHRRSHEADVEAQIMALAMSHQHVQIQENPEVRLHSHEHNHKHIGNGDPAPCINRTDTNVSKSTMRSLRRRGRSDTTCNIIYEAPGMGRTTGWSPGQEPGVDTSEPAPAYTAVGLDSTHYERVSQRCEITVVDFSNDTISMTDLGNDNLEEFLLKTPDESSDVRWINVNGLSWDVIRLLG